MRPLALLLLLAALPARADDATKAAAGVVKDMQAAGADITARRSERAAQDQAAAARQAEADKQDAAARSAHVREDIDTIQKTDLKIYELSEAGWTHEQMSQLAKAIREGSKAVRELHARHPSAVADAYHNGTMTNIEDTFKLFGDGNLERGCLSHQAATGGALRSAKLDLLEIKNIMVGKVLEHHAVIVYPKGSDDWKKSGVVLDGWRYQTDEPKQMIFSFTSWNRTFWSLPYPRLED